MGQQGVAVQQFIDIFFAVKFFPCLLLACLLFSAYLPGRKFFLLRFVSSFLLTSALSVLLWQAVKSEPVGEAMGSFAFVLCDILYFFEMIAFTCFNFRCSFFEAVLYNVCGWAVEHIANSLVMVFAVLLRIETIYFDYSVEYFVLTVLVYLIVYAAAFIVFWALRRGCRINLNKKKLLLPTILILVTAVVLSINTPVAEVSSRVLFIIKLYAVVCCVTSLCLSFSIFEAGQYRFELETLEQLDRKKQEQYEISKETIEVINIKCHDLKKLVGSALAQRAVLTGKEMEDIDKKLSIYDALVKTGNDALDLILTEKSLYCEKNNIKLTIMADAEGLGFMSDAEIYSLFGNILDNAVEASMRAAEDMRAISLRVKTVGEMISIHEENYFAGTLKFRNGTPVTSKTNTNDHGYGILSIRRIAEKYGGGLTISAQDGVFCLDVLLAAPQK